MKISINLEFGDGDFEHGFEQNQLVVKVSTFESKIIQIPAQLSSSPEIPQSCDTWRQYYSLSNELRAFKKNQVSHISSQNCYR